MGNIIEAEMSAMYLVLGGAILVLIGVYVLLNILTGNRKQTNREQ